MEQDQDNQAVPKLDDESGKVIVVAEDGSLSTGKDNESEYYLKPGNKVWYRSNYDFELIFPDPPTVPVSVSDGYGTMTGPSGSPANRCLQSTIGRSYYAVLAQTQGQHGSWHR